MRIVLDANVLIAAGATHGLCESVMELCLERHQILTCTEIVVDVEEKLVRKMKVKASVAAAFALMLRQQSERVVPEWVPPEACRDRDDLAILGMVAPGRADVVVTGDKDLLVLKSYKGVPIQTPREFWDHVTR